jgi:hypothetical protein
LFEIFQKNITSLPLVTRSQEIGEAYDSLLKLLTPGEEFRERNKKKAVHGRNSF